MSNLSSFVHYACGVLNFDTKGADDLPLLLQEAVKFCESYNKITDYYLIGHDDTDVIHIHFIFFSFSQVQLMTYFNKLRNWFVPKYTRDEYGINIEKCKSLNAHLNYIIHQSKASISEGKKAYSVEDIVSNLDIDVLESTIQSKKGSCDAYFLRDAVLDCLNDFELMVKLTLPVYHRYSNEIRILRENRAYLSMMRDKERQEKLDEELPF